MTSVLKRIWLALFLAGAGFGASANAETKPLLVFAAASLQGALDAAAMDFTIKSGIKITISYAASSALAKQIDQGAPADVFLSADLQWMDWATQRKLIRSDTRFTLASNALVLVTATENPIELTIGQGFPLVAALADGKLAMADPDTVPAGRYAKASLTTLGVWDAVSSHIAVSENVRAALAFVATGEAPLGIVYATDAQAEPRVRVIGTFPKASHAPILYPVAITTQSQNGEVSRFLEYLRSSDAQAIFTGFGFAKPE